MTPIDVVRRRMSGQLIGGAPLAAPVDVVRWMGAIQAQDYLGALWAIGLRMPHATEAGIERALADRSIVRTWPQRGTLHFVAAEDVRWMMDLLAPRNVARSARRLRELGLEATDLARSRSALADRLRGGGQLRREVLYEALEAAGVSTAGQRGMRILWWLAQDGFLCCGVREGRQQTFALLDEWVPPDGTLSREQALAELSMRYFRSRGPATLQDFVWWSGLTAADARAGLDAAREGLVPAQVDGRDYWLAPERPPAGSADPAAASRTIHLLPGFDEYLLGYKDRTAVLDPVHARQANAGGGLIKPTIVVGGRVVGTWRRSATRATVEVAASWFAEPGGARTRAFAAAADRYAAFLGLPVAVKQAW